MSDTGAAASVETANVVQVFLDALSSRDPELSINYVSSSSPAGQEDNRDAVTIDGWWYTEDIASALEAAMRHKGNTCGCCTGECEDPYGANKEPERDF